MVKGKRWVVTNTVREYGKKYLINIWLFLERKQKIGLVNQWVSRLYECLKFTSVWMQTSIVLFNSVRQHVGLGPHMRNWKLSVCTISLQKIWANTFSLMCLFFIFFMKQPPWPALAPCGPANKWKKKTVNARGDLKFEGQKNAPSHAFGIFTNTFFSLSEKSLSQECPGPSFLVGNWNWMEMNIGLSSTEKRGDELGDTKNKIKSVLLHSLKTVVIQKNSFS